MKLCKDCKHYKPPHFTGKCSISEWCSAYIPGTEPEFDPVTGREDEQRHDPRWMRREAGHCGREARLFERRQSLLKRLVG